MLEQVLYDGSKELAQNETDSMKFVVSNENKVFILYSPCNKLPLCVYVSFFGSKNVFFSLDEKESDCMAAQVVIYVYQIYSWSDEFFFAFLFFVFLWYVAFSIIC